MKKFVAIKMLMLMLCGAVQSQTTVTDVSLPIQTFRNIKNAADSGRACMAEARLLRLEIVQLKYENLKLDSAKAARGIMIRDKINENDDLKELLQTGNDLLKENEKKAAFFEKAYTKERRKTRATSIAGVVATGVLITLYLSK